jgi:hypothetical protein
MKHKAALVTLALLAAPLAAGAQAKGKPVRLGLLYGGSPAFNPESDPFDRAFVQALRENGYVVGQHVVIEFRSALGEARSAARSCGRAGSAPGRHLGAEMTFVYAQHRR